MNYVAVGSSPVAVTYFRAFTLALWQMKDYEEKSNFILRTIFSEMPRSHAKMRLKSAPPKLSFVNAKAI